MRSFQAVTRANTADTSLMHLTATASSCHAVTKSAGLASANSCSCMNNHIPRSVRVRTSPYCCASCPRRIDVTSSSIKCQKNFPSITKYSEARSTRTLRNHAILRGSSAPGLASPSLSLSDSCSGTGAAGSPGPWASRGRRPYLAGLASTSAAAAAPASPPGGAKPAPSSSTCRRRTRS